ncbi:MAG: DUF6152 family protein [Pseudomonadota bacterium]
MKRNSKTVWTLALALLFFSSALAAHHSTSVFDITTPIRVKGIVNRVEFMNPHAVIFLDQETADGTIVTWALESSATLLMLERRGFTEDTVKVGDIVDACGFAPKRQFKSSNASPESGDLPPLWMDNTDKVITARLLLLPNGPDVHWSHYGPLEDCISAEELEVLTAKSLSQ